MTDEDQGEVSGGVGSQGVADQRPATLPVVGMVRRQTSSKAETGAELAPPKRGPGRPKGARNRRTSEVAEYLVETYGDPLHADVAIGTMEPGELVTLLRSIASDRGIKLGMTLGEVLRWQRDCRSNALPYLHAKRAPENDKGETVVPVIGFGTFQGHDETAGRSIEEAQQNQTLIDGEIVKSHDEKSHDPVSD